MATRFDKLAVRYQATIAVADIFIWPRAKPDQPQGDPSNALLGAGSAGGSRRPIDGWVPG